MTTVERALNSIGKKCLIDYYEDFRSCIDKNALTQKLHANDRLIVEFKSKIKIQIDK